MSSNTIVFIEAFYGGSHKQLIDLVFNLFSKNAELYTLPAKKWHWRSLASALYFADMIPPVHNFSRVAHKCNWSLEDVEASGFASFKRRLDRFCVLFTSSVLPLAELTALRPDLAHLHKIVYFHENQMVYPVREKKARYFHHGFNEVMTSLVADKVVFNSEFNKESFLSNISTFFNIMPDCRPKNLKQKIQPKCSVLPFPLHFSKKLSKPSPIDTSTETGMLHDHNIVEKKDDIIHIVWPHRWEHDKDPETFFSVLFKLKDLGIPFHLSVIGESFSEKPDIFKDAEERLSGNILHWGYKNSREEYEDVLQSADIVVSTAKHEFFGVSMLEAACFNCFPLCPKRLVYPEIYPDEYLYNTDNQLFKKLKYFCSHPYVIRNHKLKVDLSKFSWEFLMPEYKKLFEDIPEKTNSR